MVPPVLYWKNNRLYILDQRVLPGAVMFLECTTAEDVAIRNKVYEKVGPKLARRALAQMFPGGSAKGEVEERRERFKERLGTADESTSSNILVEISNEVIALAERLRMNID